MKVAIVHDQLQEFGGAERVLVALKRIYPEADVYTSFYSPSKLGIHADAFKDWKIITSWADKVPFIKGFYSPFRFINPLIWESFDFSKYDLVISSSGWFMSKGIITRPETTHVCYLHHPPRSFYYYETAVEWQKHLPFKIYGTLINHGLRLWDYLSSQRPDYFIANSQETKRRIEKLYRREATVIYPPVVIPKHIPAVDGKYEYYLTISRLARAKHIDVLIQAANNLKMPLKIVGTGRDEEHLKSIAGDTVEFLGSLPDNELSSVYAHAKAFLFASVDEEFGIAPVEAMGHGIPVIGFASGGVKEIIQNNSGFLYEQLTPESLSNEIEKLEHMSREDYLQMRKDARRQAEQFSVDVFEKKIHEFITKVTSH